MADFEIGQPMDKISKFGIDEYCNLINTCGTYQDCNSHLFAVHYVTTHRTQK